jgi:isopenicillin N synthase-like dioxygenase
MGNGKVPVIDISAMNSGEESLLSISKEFNRACTSNGFFYIIGHGISPKLQFDLEHVTREFFEADISSKKSIPMSDGGKAWRGYFPVGDELTSGKPDLKEGLYFGSELPSHHPKVRSGTPLHGSNLFPDFLPEMRAVVLDYMDQVTHLGHQLMRILSVSLGLPDSYFNENYTSDPLTLFRIFHYPPSKMPVYADAQWGVGEHTDYGVLTLLKQDNIGGLQVKSKSGWIDAPFIPNSFICNIGDMLDRMTKGYYKSTPHRVLNTSGKSRYSWPFFFDPKWDAPIHPLPIENADFSDHTISERWDGADVHAFEGTYGDYILGKVGKVFPDLMQKVKS